MIQKDLNRYLNKKLTEYLFAHETIVKQLDIKNNSQTGHAF